MQGADISRLLDHIAATLYYNSVEVKDGFDVFDVDGDGRLSIDDFRTAIAQLDLTMIRDEEVEALFASLDMNEDGFISMAEWDLGMKSADRGKVLAPKAGADPVRDLGHSFDAMRAELEASQLAAERMLVNLSAATAGQKGIFEALHQAQQDRSSHEKGLDRLLQGHRLASAGDDPALVKWYPPSERTCFT